ncbi:sensor histidine kinase [Variovorax sp. LT1R16]|uniref:sensor histidine kinase n=1 Tax=Variovorax sp. LT1R16 TaxID=3443728 RepID=UPI003F45C23C
MPLFKSSLFPHITPFLAALRRCLVACACLLAMGLGTPAEALVLMPSHGLSDPITLSGTLEMLRDPQGRWRIADVASDTLRGDFERLEGTLQEGFSRDPVWLRFSLSRAPDAPARWLLRVRPSTLNEVTLYAPDGQGGFVQTALGDRRAFAEREIPDHNFVFPIDVPPIAGEYFLRVHNDGPPLRAELDLWQPAGFERQQMKDYTVVGLLLGTAVLSICMNLIFMVWLKDGLYGHYALYVLCSAVMTMARQGYMAEWILDAHPARVAQAVLAVNCFSNVVATAFMARIFGFRHHWVPAARFFNLVVVFNIAALLVALTDYHTAIPRWVSAGSAASTLFGALFVCYLLIVRRQFQYLLPASAFSVGTILGLYGLLKLWLGDLVPGARPDRIYMIGSLTHLILLNIAVADRTRRAERNLRVERERVMSVRIEAEQALESTVARRTAELAQTNSALRDEIAQRSRLEAQLLDSLDGQRKAVEQQNEFVSMVSHEFRTPLAVIDAAAQSIDILKFGADPVVKLRTGRIRRSVQRLAMLIENVLTADRFQIEQRALKLEPVNLIDLARGLCETFNLPEPARLQLEAHLPLAEIRGDRSLLEIALQNLMHNALKYSPSESTVRVSLRRVGEGVQIDVVDRGSGVRPEDAERIFEKYFRSETATTIPGSGLGLHLSREIARRHGGDATLVATGVAGSTFRLVLPVRPLDKSDPRLLGAGGDQEHANL